MSLALVVRFKLQGFMGSGLWLSGRIYDVVCIRTIFTIRTLFEGIYIVRACI